MRKVIWARFVAAALPISILIATPKGMHGIALCALGVLTIGFSLGVLPGWNLARNYFQGQGKVVRMPPSLGGARPIDAEIQRARGQSVAFEYQVGEKLVVSDRDRLWPMIFRPFSGRDAIRLLAEESLRDGSHVTVFISRKDPETAYLTLAPDWAMISVACLIGFLAIALGAADILV